MPINEFWYGDTRLLGVYQKSFLRNQSYNAWLQGQYNFIAYNVVMANAFAKKGAKLQEYPKWKDPIPKPRTEIITKQNLEQKFRESQVKQNSWLHNILHK